MNTIIKTSDFLGDFVLDKWNAKYKWVRRINRVSPAQLISDTQRVSDYEGEDLEDWDFYYFKKFAKRFRLKDYNEKYEVIKNDRQSLNDALLSKKSFKELFQTDVDKIQDKQAFIDAVQERATKYGGKPLTGKKLDEEIFSNGFIGHKSFELYNTLRDVYKDMFKRIFKSSELYTLQQFLTDYNHSLKQKEEKSYNTDYKVFEYLQDLFGKPVYKLGDCLRQYIQEDLAYSDLSKNQYFMQITHFGDDKENIKNSDNKFNDTISFWVFEDRVVYQEDSGRSSW
jgi:hypothetical protein